MRDEFSQTVKQIVANRVNWLCSNPDCRCGTGGPQLNPAKAINLGVAAHITAASVNGPRYDASISQEDRTHATNAIWLCQNCAKLVDNDEERFPATLLKKWKDSAELSALATLGKTASVVDTSFGNLSPEEIDILCAAGAKGEIHVMEVDELSPWVIVNGEHFADDSDPACAAQYLEALESLLNRGLVRHEGGILYGLKGSGFKVARALNQARLSASQADDDKQKVGEERDAFSVARKLAVSQNHNEKKELWLGSREGLKETINAVNEVLSSIKKRYMDERSVFDTLGISLHEKKGFRSVYNKDFISQISLEGFNERAEYVSSELHLRLEVYSKRPYEFDSNRCYTDLLEQEKYYPELAQNNTVIWRSERSETLSKEQLIECVFGHLMAQIERGPPERRDPFEEEVDDDDDDDESPYSW